MSRSWFFLLAAIIYSAAAVPREGAAIMALVALAIAAFLTFRRGE